MKYNVILFSDIAEDFRGGRATVVGAYRIASHLRYHGYSAKVIANISYLLEHHARELYKYLQKIISTEETLIIGFSLTFLDSSGVIHIDNLYDRFAYFIKSLKKYFPSIKIVVGGGSNNAKTLLEMNEQYIDAYIRGFGESGIIKYIEMIEGKNDKFHGQKIIEYDILGNEFDFHNQPNLLDKDHDIIIDSDVLPMEMSRGCRFKCKFCQHPLLGRNPNDQSYIRSQYSMAKEFEYNYKNFGTTSYSFLCDTFNETTEKLLTVKRALDDVGIKIKFASYMRLDLIHAHPEQIDILKELGVVGVFFGIESFCDPASKSVGKGLGREKALSTLRLLRKKWGDDVFMTSGFVIGLPHETKETANEWSQMLINKETPLDNFQMNALSIEKETSNLWTSEFGRNPEKHGYTTDKSANKSGVFGLGGWSKQNDIKTWAEARHIRDYWIGERDKIAPDLSGWGIPGLLNAGWTWDEIHDYNNTADNQNRIDYQNRIKEYHVKQLKAYVKKLF
jgi:radical SAM superfamily enzyme YgiQ (UPF0313 family)